MTHLLTVFVVAPVTSNLKTLDAFYSEHATREAAMARVDHLRRLACYVATGRRLDESCLGWSEALPGWRRDDMVVTRSWLSSDKQWSVLETMPASVLN
jgi:hypothetical protein